MITQALSAIKEQYGIEERCYLIDKNNKIVKFDSVESESWSASTTVSSYSVEKGEDMSDHVKVNAESLSIKAAITNHTGINSMDEDSLSRVQGSQVEDVITEKLNQLYEWRSSGALLTYFGAVKDPVENMVITSLSPSKDSSTGEAFDLSVSMQHVIIAEYQTALLDLPGTARATIKKGLAKLAPLKVRVDIKNASVKSLLF